MRSAAESGNPFRRLLHHRYFPDAVSVLLLLGLSLYLMRPLLHWNTRVLASDLSGVWAWFYWLKESLFTFHQFPTWSPLWMSGMPFFGMVPPAGFFLVLPVYGLAGDIPAAYNIATILAFSTAGVSMYAYLKHLSGNPLASFLGALLYIILPVHMSSMMFWGLFEIMCAYALVPLVLLLTDSFLDGKGQWNMALLGLTLAVVLLLQIEYALIFLLFYMAYLVFAVSIRGIGLRRLRALIGRSQWGIAICLLMLLLPLSFYLVVLMKYNQFSGVPPFELEHGLDQFTFRHFGDPFQDKLAGGLTEYFSSLQTDYYGGGVSFFILLASLAFAATEKGGRRAQLLFFLIAGLASLVLSLGVFGPLFPVLRRIVPYLSGMRVPLRFYYIFALCLPVLFSLTFLSLERTLAGAHWISPGMRRLAGSGVPALLILLLVLDLAPYFNFYHHRVLDKEDYNRVSSFIEQQVAQDSQATDNIARVLMVSQGVQPDRIARIARRDQSQLTIEVSQSSLEWNQFRAASEYNSAIYDPIFRNAQSLVFYSDVLSYDYIALYDQRLPVPPQDPDYLHYREQLRETLDRLCNDGSQTLVDRGRVETQYYAVQLYRINNHASGKAGFYSLGESLLLTDGDLDATRSLLVLYRAVFGVSQDVTPRDFSSTTAAVFASDPLPASVSSDPGIAGSLNYEGEVLLLPKDPARVQVLEAEDCEAEGWVAIDRENGWGLPDSGIGMAVGDVTLETDQHLGDSFDIAQTGEWMLSICYLAWFDTGDIDVYIDGQLVSTIDTYSEYMAMKTRTIRLPLSEGTHQVTLVGRHHDRGGSGGSQGNWVEVDKIVLLNEKAFPDLVAESRALWSRIASVCIGAGNPVQSIEAEDCEGDGWSGVDREGCCGVPTSGFTMAVPDVTLAEDNYLKKAFLIGSGGAWTLDVSYLEYVDTGILDIYVDDVLIDSVDTYGPKLAMNAVAVDLSLNPGLHEVKLAGRSSEREIVSGSMGHWVEVDGVVLRANGATAGTPPPSSVTRISDLALSPRGASLDIDAGSEGIVWIAYYANPWWKTYVDGQEAEVLTINGVFPGCRVPGGRHRVEFIYNYPSPMNLFSLVPR